MTRTMYQCVMMVAAVVVLVIAASAIAGPKAGVSANDTADTSATTTKAAAMDCPAGYHHGTRECKRARAARKCPELKGGVCKGK
ncbi:MAG: hypothetical protein WCK47_01330 [bacterium]